MPEVANGTPVRGWHRVLLERIGGSLLDLVLPLRCAGCGAEGAPLCGRCQAGLPRLTAPVCFLCAQPGVAPVCARCADRPPATDGIRAPYLHEGPVRQLVHRLKYSGARSYAACMADLLYVFLEAHPLEADVIVPVPLHRARERERGYNQSELLARPLARKTGIPLAATALRRTRDTPAQVSLDSAEARRRNMEGAFQCQADMAGRRVLLVDDVVTTGATMSACATALKTAGTATVWGLAFARQAPPN